MVRRSPTIQDAQPLSRSQSGRVGGRPVRGVKTCWSKVDRRSVPPRRRITPAFRRGKQAVAGVGRRAPPGARLGPSLRRPARRQVFAAIVACRPFARFSGEGEPSGEHRENQQVHLRCIRQGVTVGEAATEKAEVRPSAVYDAGRFSHRLSDRPAPRTPVRFGAVKRPGTACPSDDGRKRFDRKAARPSSRMGESPHRNDSRRIRKRTFRRPRACQTFSNQEGAGFNGRRSPGASLRPYRRDSRRLRCRRPARRRFFPRRFPSHRK